MRSQRVANFVDRLDQSVAEFFVPKMFAHSSNESLPQFFATLLMDRLVPDDREFVGAGRHENSNRIALLRFVHAELMKSFLRCNKWIGAQFAALNKNANLAGSF